jgi:hypothetical protein
MSSYTGRIGVYSHKYRLEGQQHCAIEMNDSRMESSAWNTGILDLSECVVHGLRRYLLLYKMTEDESAIQMGTRVSPGCIAIWG